MQKELYSESPSMKKVYYYHCKQPGCTYKTIRSGHLKRHERTHTKEKPYKCSLCSYTASRSDHLRRHLKIHFKDICAVNSSLVTDVDTSVCNSSATMSPVSSPSPMVSASSSPSLHPIALDDAEVPVGFLGPNAYDNGVSIFIGFLNLCYQQQRL